MPGTRTIACHSSVGTVGGTAALYVGKVPTRPLERPGRQVEFRAEVWDGDIQLGLVTIWMLVMSQIKTTFR